MYKSGSGRHWFTPWPLYKPNNCAEQHVMILRHLWAWATSANLFVRKSVFQCFATPLQGVQAPQAGAEQGEQLRALAQEYRCDHNSCRLRRPRPGSHRNAGVVLELSLQPGFPACSGSRRAPRSKERHLRGPWGRRRWRLPDVLHQHTGTIGTVQARCNFSGGGGRCAEKLLERRSNGGGGGASGLGVGPARRRSLATSASSS